ncbi:sulfatase-like hydrolase/transferase [Ferrimonas marina]|uniref:Arylsulfatase A n=1 Tax=Ferrimonas marina TaxID=299255 RepID=A0A1M5RXN5_9GAMM|nr:sulfatase-like hydrolase/transferase [Ferrimonas marina]SHH30788.1 Arylsulfatase A [Ferrimonas marina]
MIKHAGRAVALTAAGLTLAPVLAPALAEPAPLNFIWIVADDLGYGDTGFNGSTQIPTPHMDRIAEAGIAMSSAYVSAPVCGPSRAGYHTGMYQHRFGHEGLVGNSGLGTPTDVLMIQEHLQTLGYHTGLVGKFHDGKAEQYQPWNRGFDEYYGFNNGALTYWVGDNEEQLLYRNDTLVEREDRYLTDAFGEEAVDFIARNAESPFFLEVAFTAPHAPMEATEQKLAEFEHLGERQVVAAMISSMDDAIGDILDELETQGIAHQTMVVLFSDNGGKLSNQADNGPLRDQKATTFEGALRVPFAAALPGVIPAKQRSDVMISALDLFPTTVLLAGGELLPDWTLDGKDILPVLTGASQVSPHDQLFWRYNNHWALRDGDWKLMRSGRHPMMLFNLADDIGEQDNRSEQQPARVKQLREQWNRTSAELGPAAWGPYKGEVERD